jgi:hypothetical protein
MFRSCREEDPDTVIVCSRASGSGSGAAEQRM